MRVSYTAEQRRVAVATYRRLGSYSKALRVLGYPSRHVLHDWVRGSKPGPKKQVVRRPPRQYSWEFKAQAVQRVLAGEEIRVVGEDLGMTTHMLLYKWLRRWREGGDRALMSKAEKRKADGFATRAQLEASLPEREEDLRKLAAQLLVDKAVLERELELVKKDEGVIPGQLSNLHKTRIVEGLRNRLPLACLLESSGLKPSSYHYCTQVLRRPDKHALLRGRIHEIAKDSGFTYGSPRIWLALRREGTSVSEKVIRRLMKEEQIKVHHARRKLRYSSYEGERTPAPRDRVQRDFHSDQPNRLWLTDISEFAAPDAKIYLSPMIDCADGMVGAYRVSRSPNKDLTQGMLEDAIQGLPQEFRDQLRAGSQARLIIHTDRGGHYRGGEWIETMNAAGLTRSMSRKGRTGDNAACEGFFGRMKTEMFYNRPWQSATAIEEAIHQYIHFYNHHRIKTTLGGLTITEYRQQQEAKPSRKPS